MARLRAGDRAAARPVFDAAWPRALALASAALGPGPDAEDAAQQALERVFEQAAGYDPARSALAWVLAITTWEVRTVRSRRRRAAARGGSAEDLTDVADEGPGAEESLISQELSGAAWGLLDVLDPADRELVDAAIAGRPPDLPGVAPTTVRKRRQRAFERLRDAWRALHGD
ncbi:MAG: sigma-70 family RNA polymerase sigma factor [Myxococcales bacterium]|nr:sigma-70 family RNA polymerase sigma factor [Myxococcales bacterium]MCB9519962.1 sigma-70 family RNA polymerase sigma factor [Myxococcales bacterium]MCB9532509.1 sigma-70 family RNA polymerase sigma factor [Myxococcales bacterium]